MTDKTPLKPFVATIDKSLVETLRGELISQGFEFSTPPYTHFAAKKKGISVTLYTSLKLTVMGKEMREFIEFFLSYNGLYLEINIKIFVEKYQTFDPYHGGMKFQ